MKLIQEFYKKAEGHIRNSQLFGLTERKYRKSTD